MTLCALPVLLSNRTLPPSSRRRAHRQIALQAVLGLVRALSEGERQQAIAPVMNKLRAFLLRPAHARRHRQAEPAFDLSSVFTERKVLLVSLAKGLHRTRGRRAARLTRRLTALAGRPRSRARAAPEPTPVMVYIDEFQEYLHLPLTSPMCWLKLADWALA